MAQRCIPLSARILILFGGYLSIFAWGFLGIGMMAFWAFTMNGDFRAPLFLEGSETSTGRILSIGSTNFSVDEGEVIKSYSYIYSTPGEQVYKGISYGVGYFFKQGDTVTIEYLRNNPSVSRIQGMNGSPISFVVAVLTCLFPLIGIVLLVAIWIAGKKSLRLLEWGVVGEHIEVQSLDGSTRMMPVLHDPSDSSKLLRPDTLPGKPVISSSGDIQLEDFCPIRLFIVLLVPAVVILGNAWYIYSHFLSGK